MNGKGSRRRPTEVPPEVFEDNWARTFKKKSEFDLITCAACFYVFDIPLGTESYTCPHCGVEGSHVGQG